MTPLLQKDRKSFDASTPSMCCSYKRIRAFGVPRPPLISYCTRLFVNGTAAQRKVVAHIVEAKLSVLPTGAFVRAVRDELVEHISYSHIIEKSEA